jgi:flagellar motor protein MotB
VKTPPVSLLIAFFVCLFLILGFSPAASPQGRPASAGQQELRKYESTHGTETPPQPPQRHVDTAQLQRDADELSSLAQSIPADIQSVTKGTLPKDLLEKLRRIEKLSKHLRSEVAQ